MNNQYVSSNWPTTSMCVYSKLNKSNLAGSFPVKHSF